MKNTTSIHTLNTPIGFASFAGILLISTTSVWAQTTALVMKGDAAAGTSATFFTLGVPIMNADGRVAFTAKITGAGINSRNNVGIWADDANGNRQLVVRVGDDAPNATGAATGLTFAKLGNPVYNSNEETAFIGAVKGTSSGGFTAIIPPNTSPDTAGQWEQFAGTWNSGSATSITLLIADLTDAGFGNDFALDDISFQEDVAGAINLVTNGDFSDGNSDFSSAYNYSPGMSASPGDYSLVTDPHNFNGNLTSFGDHTTGTGQMMVVDGGAPGLTVWSQTIAVTPNTPYEFSFWAATTYPFAHATLIATDDVVTGPVGPVTTATDDGVWSNVGGSLRLVASEGSQAPGCPPGATFGKFAQIALPDQGGVVISSKLKGAGVTFTNDFGIWAVDTNGVLTLIAREGDTQIETGKTIKMLSFLPVVAGVSGQTRGFSQTTGDLVYSATFTDGSAGIFRVVFP